MTVTPGTLAAPLPDIPPEPVSPPAPADLAEIAAIYKSRLDPLGLALEDIAPYAPGARFLLEASADPSFLPAMAGMDAAERASLTALVHTS